VTNKLIVKLMLTILMSMHLENCKELRCLNLKILLSTNI